MCCHWSGSEPGQIVSVLSFPLLHFSFVFLSCIRSGLFMFNRLRTIAFVDLWRSDSVLSDLLKTDKQYFLNEL